MSFRGNSHINQMSIFHSARLSWTRERVCFCHVHFWIIFLGVVSLSWALKSCHLHNLKIRLLLDLGTIWRRANPSFSFLVTPFLSAPCYSDANKSRLHYLLVFSETYLSSQKAIIAIGTAFYLTLDHNTPDSYYSIYIEIAQKLIFVENDFWFSGCFVFYRRLVSQSFHLPYS